MASDNNKRSLYEIPRSSGTDRVNYLGLESREILH